MATIIILSQELGTDIRSRKSAQIIEKIISSVQDSVIIDFKSIMFISRSFADELLNIINAYKSQDIRTTNMCKNVQLMFNTVKESRSKKHVKPTSENKMNIFSFENINSLSSFLINTI